MHHPLPQKSVVRFTIGAVAVPALLVGLAGIASAAEFGPFAGPDTATESVPDVVVLVDENLGSTDDLGDRLTEGVTDVQDQFADRGPESTDRVGANTSGPEGELGETVQTLLG